MYNQNITSYAVRFIQEEAQLRATKERLATAARAARPRQPGLGARLRAAYAAFVAGGRGAPAEPRTPSIPCA